jgi:hypothetical protein
LFCAVSVLRTRRIIAYHNNITEYFLALIHSTISIGAKLEAENTMNKTDMILGT